MYKFNPRPDILQKEFYHKFRDSFGFPVYVKMPEERLNTRRKLIICHIRIFGRTRLCVSAALKAASSFSVRMGSIFMVKRRLSSCTNIFCCHLMKVVNLVVSVRCQIASDIHFINTVTEVRKCECRIKGFAIDTPKRLFHSFLNIYIIIHFYI